MANLSASNDLTGKINVSGTIVASMIAQKGATGATGQDGVSPTITTSKTGKVTTITITDKQGTHTATINDGNDGQGAGSWGEISGTLSNQTDLQAALNSKANTSDIPTKTSDLTNDSGFLNSDRLFSKLIPSGTEIPNNSDLNNITFLSLGSYYTSSDQNTQTLENCPTTQAFIMEVHSPLSKDVDNETTGAWVYRIREITTHQGDKYIQSCNSNGDKVWSFQSWKKFANNNDYIPKTGGDYTGKITAPEFQTGTDANNYFQSKKFRGSGDANTYYHAVDFGYAQHDQVDFYEYGGLWNFWKNTQKDATTSDYNKCLAITQNALKNKYYTYTWPDKTGTFALTSDIPTVPTKTSDLTNDSGFLTSHQDISGKVDKETGKGLSTNDYSAADKTKLNDLANIKSVGTGLELNSSTGELTATGGGGGTTYTAGDNITIENDTISATVPTKTSDLTNDSGFLDDAQSMYIIAPRAMLLLSNATVQSNVVKILNYYMKYKCVPNYIITGIANTASVTSGNNYYKIAHLYESSNTTDYVEFSISFMNTPDYFTMTSYTGTYGVPYYAIKTKLFKIYVKKSEYSSKNITNVYSNSACTAKSSASGTEMETRFSDGSYTLGTTNTTAYTPTGDYNPATKKYVDDNLPTSGSNDNGSWVKYPDGTMICYLNIAVTDQAINTAYGNLFIGNRLWTFPQTFVDTPSVSCGLFHWGNSASWGGTYSPTVNQVNLRGFDAVSRATGTSCRIQAIAIGKWK